MTGRPSSRGAFITVEGGEGGGKSTQVRALVARLRSAGLNAIATREPGGSEIAELIRESLLMGTFERFGAKAEALLFAAARIDHIDKKIRPALEAGAWVVSDRFHDSSRAYQGLYEAIDELFMTALERVTMAETKPDLTLIIDVPAEIGLERAAARRRQNEVADRFEKQSLEFHKALREAFIAIAAADPDRCVIVDGTQTPEDVEQAIWDTIVHRLRVERDVGRPTGPAA